MVYYNTNLNNDTFVMTPGQFISSASPTEGQVRWHPAQNAIEVFNGKEWQILLTAEQLHETYQLLKAKEEQQTAQGRFEMIMADLEEDEFKMKNSANKPSHISDHLYQEPATPSKK